MSMAVPTADVRDFLEVGGQRSQKTKALGVKRFLRRAATYPVAVLLRLMAESFPKSVILPEMICLVGPIAP